MDEQDMRSTEDELRKVRQALMVSLWGDVRYRDGKRSERTERLIAQAAAIRDLLADEAESAAETGELDSEWDVMGPDEAEWADELGEPDYLGRAA
jgi:hypothetical protein